MPAGAQDRVQQPCAAPSTADHGTEEIGAEVLAGLRFAAWPAAPAQHAEPRRPPAPASTASVSRCSVAASDSECDGVDWRPRKVRVVQPAAEAPALRRTYTWRSGTTCRRAAKQQQQQPQDQQQQQQQQGGKEGDRAFAALTTWLRMNLHTPRTAKRVVQFVGRCDGNTGRWAFDLNPRLSWADLGADTRARLRDLPAEALHAFRAKYPARAPADWRLKSQRYRPPGGQAGLVLLEDLVLGLHAIWLRHERDASLAGATGAELAPQSPTASGPPTPALARSGSSMLRLA